MNKKHRPTVFQEGEYQAMTGPYMTALMMRSKYHWDKTSVFSKDDIRNWSFVGNKADYYMIEPYQVLGPSEDMYYKIFYFVNNNFSEKELYRARNLENAAKLILKHIENEN